MYDQFVDVLTNASKVLRDTFYYVSYCLSDYRFQHDLIPYAQGLSILKVRTIATKVAVNSCCVWLKIIKLYANF
jgi:hypothetical protein